MGIEGGMEISEWAEEKIMILAQTLGRCFAFRKAEKSSADAQCCLHFSVIAVQVKVSAVVSRARLTMQHHSKEY